MNLPPAGPVRRWCSRLLLIIVLAAVAWVVAGNISEIRRYDFSLRLFPLLMSFLTILAAFFAQFLIWTMVADAFGIRSGFVQSGAAWATSGLGRYVPGKVAILLVRFDLYKGQSKRKITAASGVEQVAQLASACLLVLLAVIFSSRGLPDYVRWYALAGALLFLVLLWPGVLLGLINTGFRFLRKDPLEELPSYPRLLFFVLLYLGSSLIHGLGFFLLLQALTPMGAESFLPVTAIYYSAGLIGLMAFFAPSGIGVREGVLLALLPYYAPMPVVVVAALAIRLTASLAEITLAAAFLLSARTCR